MDSILKKLNIHNVFTKKPQKQKIFNKVKTCVPPIANYNFEADLLHLPTTKAGYKYLFVITDLANNKFDIEPMKTKSSSETVEVLKKILKRKYIKEPEISLKTDNGTEFKKDFDTFLNKENILHITTLPHRHKQMANVESLNKQLGKIFNEYMNMKEIETDEHYDEWTDILTFVRKELNKHREITLPAYKDWKIKLFDPEKVTVKPKYKIGDMVHRKLDYPRNALNNNQNTATFRVGDVRWDTLARRVNKVIYMPDNPPYRYVVEGLPNVSYCELELMPSDEVEQKYEVEKFINKKSMNRKIFYLVKWKNTKVSEATWELDKDLIEDIGLKVFNELVKNMK